MSSTIAAIAPSSTSFQNSAPACASQLYNIPVQDASCAIPFDSHDNATDIMSSCCNSAAVISYYDNCGLYCLALDQSVEDLTSCLMQSGALPQDVFCRGNVTATATGSGDSVPTSAEASAVNAPGSTGSSGGSNGGSGGSSNDGLDGVDSEEDDSSGNGAVGVQGGLGVGKLAVAVLGLLAVPFWIA